MKKLSTLFILTAIAGLISLNAYADTPARMGFGMGDFGGFGHFGSFERFGGFGGFGYGMDFAGGFGHGMDFSGGFGGFGYGMDFSGGFGGFGHGMDFSDGFGGFGHGMDFTVRTVAFNPDPTIVPLPPTASVSTSATILDESGEIRIRPFDDEDLFVED